MNKTRAPAAALAALAVAAHVPVVERHHLMEAVPSLETEAVAVPGPRSDHADIESSTDRILFAAVAEVRPNVFHLKTAPLAMTGSMTVAGDFVFVS